MMDSTTARDILLLAAVPRRHRPSLQMTAWTWLNTLKGSK